MNINEALPDVQEGEQIQTIIKASGGDTNHVDHLVVYTGEEVATVNYTCRGTTLDYHCTDDALSGEHDLEEFITLFDELLQ